MGVSLARSLVRGLAIASLAVVASAPRASAPSAEPGLGGLARTVRPSVVEILGTVEGTSETSYGTGFAFLEPSLVVTNAHVVRGVPQVMVRTWGGALLASVTVLHVDESVDLAVLRVVGLDARPLPAAAIEIPNVGDSVVAVGHPRGYEFTVSDGIVSAIRALQEGGVKLIQTTAPISPGSSGGPLLDVEGRVVGVCSLTLMEGQNINFAVPVARLTPVLERALALERALVNFEPGDLDENAIIALVRRHRQAGDLVRASEIVRKALEVRGASVDLLVEAAEIAWSRGGVAEVEAILRRIDRLAPGNATGRQIRAATLAQQGRCDDAIREAREALATGLSAERSSEAHAVLGDCLARGGDAKAALEHVERALESERIALLPDYHALRALLLAGMGRGDEADREATLALELSGWDERIEATLRERGLPRLIEVISFREAREGTAHVVKGIVRNRGSVPLVSVRVSAEGLDEKGRIVATGTAQATPERLVPGQTASFRVVLDGLLDDVRKVTVRVVEFQNP